MGVRKAGKRKLGLYLPSLLDKAGQRVYHNYVALKRGGDKVTKAIKATACNHPPTRLLNQGENYAKCRKCIGSYVTRKPIGKDGYEIGNSRML